MIIRAGIPLPKGVDVRSTPVWESLSQFKHPDIRMDVAYANTNQFGHGRNVCVSNGKNCLKRQKVNGFDYYLSLDPDMKFNVEDVKALLAHRCYIVSAGYRRRSNPRQLHAGHWGKCQGDLGMPCIPGKGLVKIDWSGGGFLLIKSDVFEALDYPWFREEVIEVETDLGLLAESVSADVGFCMQCQRAGISLYCDTNTLVSHVGVQTSAAPSGIRSSFAGETCAPAGFTGRR